MLHGLTLDQMRVFLAVAETGSFRSAAIRLSRVQSAVSHAIANLEAQLGVTLFDRSARRPRLSDVGAALLPDIRTLLVKVDAVQARARSLNQGVELDLAIGVDPQFPQGILGEALRSWREAYPMVGIRLQATPLGASIDALRSSRCDLAIAGTDQVDASIELEHLIDVRRAAVAARSHPLAALASRPFDAASLADHLQIVVEDTSELTNARDYGVIAPMVWRVADNLTKRTLIEAGVGWGSLPLWMIEGPLESGALVRLPVAAHAKCGETLLRTFLARRADRPFGPAALAFRDALRTSLGYGFDRAGG